MKMDPGAHARQSENWLIKRQSWNCCTGNPIIAGGQGITLGKTAQARVNSRLAGPAWRTFADEAGS